jgi:hypothetical protein
LDAYCGLYAIANAILKINPGAFAEEEAPLALFRAMMKAASRICRPEELAHDGMDVIELEYVARVAIRFMQGKGYTFRLTRPSRLGLGSPNQSDISWFANASAITTAAVSVHIEEGNQSHWSVLIAASGNRIILFDSDHMKSVKWAHCKPFAALRRFI